MTITYKACDICGQRMSDGCVIDVRYREVKDGKRAQSQRCIDICDECWADIKECADARKEGARL